MNVEKLIAYVDGEFVPLSEAKVSILDFGLIHCDSTYDVCHVRDGRFFRLDWHLDRFFNSLEGLRLRISPSRDELATILNQCVAKNELQDAFVWMACFRGTPESGNPRDLASCKTKLMAYSKPYYGINLKGGSVALTISERMRFPKQSLDPRLKSFHWGDLTGAQFDAIDRGFDTALLVDSNGNLTEGPGFNFFVVKSGRVVTPGDGVLEGITRKSILAICTEEGIACELRDVSTSELLDADEVFLSSTSGGITPVKKVNDQSFAEDGEITQRLSEIYQQKHSDPKWSTAVSYNA